MNTDDLQLPAWVVALLAKVDRAFEVTAVGAPEWLDPHPDRGPLEEEYSRVTDPGKYAILNSRGDAWAQALTDEGLAEIHDVPAEVWTAGCRPPTQHLRVRRIEPTRPGGLQVLLASTLVADKPFGLDLGISRSGEAPVLLASVPDCGCDACDRGSADLLETLDGFILTVALGGVTHAHRGKQIITRRFNGWHSSGGADASWLLESNPVPDGVERWIGASWAQ